MRGLIPSQFGENVRWKVGIVEGRNDPQQRGRLRVRIFGVHTEDKTLIPTEKLPWAIPIQSINSAALSGVGDSPTGIMLGSMVLVTFLDGNDMQIPAVLGTIGPIDGIAGSQNQTANTGAVNANGVNDSYSGTPGNVVFNSSEPKWFSVAKSQIGVYEYQGGQNNPKVLEYLSTVGSWTSDTTPWCSGFACWCFKQAGMSTEGVTAQAKSWTRAGCVEKIETPLKGCICVFNRGANPESGHVTFLDRIQGGRAVCIGGNQSDKVQESGYSLQSLCGFYWPKGFTKEGFGALS